MSCHRAVLSGKVSTTFIFQDFNKRLQSCGGGENMIRSLAQLDLKVTDMRAGLDSVENTTRWNSHSLRNLAVSINQIKVKAPTDYLTFYYGTF